MTAGRRFLLRRMGQLVFAGCAWPYALVAQAETVFPEKPVRMIVAQLHEAIANVLSQPALRDQLSGQGIEVKVSDSPEAFGAYLEQATKKYNGIAQRPADS